ncbi:MAG: hypothetical protein K8R73_07820 [Clostridiales bacterium]|nr:hypothetical protein [Clostridiales bacterium]
MKKYYTVIIGLMIILLVTGCTNDFIFGEKDLFEEASPDMKEQVEYKEDLGKFDKLVLEIDLTVSGVKISSTDSNELIYKQIANRKDLLAEMDVDTSGKTITLTFKNDPDKKINIGTQNSQTEIFIPEKLLTDLGVDLNVGDLNIKGEQLSFENIEVGLDVGALDIIISDDQDQLGEIELSSNVGDLVLELKGNFPALHTLKTLTDVGSNSVTLDGEYGEKLSLKGESHVGELTYQIIGDFEKNVDAVLTSNTGELNLKLPKNSPVELITESNEFTSKVDINIDDYTIKNDVYMFNTSGNGGEISIKASVNIGDLTVD